MPQLLQRATGMKVIQVKDRTRVRPDCVYVIPPNKDMSILHGVLHLLEPAAPRGLRLPIDFFLRSLALDQQEHSIGVILSGMGSDGTLGLRAIKEKAGVVLVQEPATAKFDGMPRSAIDAGLADIVAPVDELPAKIMAYLRRTPLVTKAEPALPDKTQGAMEKAVILLRAHTGHDFSLYKRNTLYRRIERRMGIHQIDKIAAYDRYLQENSQELDLLFKELLIGATSFFRDPAAWEQLREQAISPLIRSQPASHALRAWVPGCSSGEEAYSLAIVFKEALEQVKPRGSLTLQIFATDLDRDAIDKARQGLFPYNIAADVSPERLGRFFDKEEHGYRVRKEIREMVIFAPQNLIMDPPFTKLEILSCRNLLIYLAPEVQKKLFPLFHYSLNPGGTLFLGSAETIGGATHLFAALDAKAKLFRRSASAAQLEPKAQGRFRKTPAHSPRLAELERELQQGREELQTTREEMQTSQEELKSTNEELQSANEELQSTNEELTTSKEEMQSLNEELQTVNTELQARVDDLSLANSDMKNLLNSTDIATLFLDNDLHVRRFTTQATKIIRLIPGDVGRPITDLASDLRYPDLAKDAQEVLRTLVLAEKAITARDGRWFTVRIMPYRTLDNRIDGVVITFTDITAAKKVEAELRHEQTGLEKRIAEQGGKPEGRRG